MKYLPNYHLAYWKLDGGYLRQLISLTRAWQRC